MWQYSRQSLKLERQFEIARGEAIAQIIKEFSNNRFEAKRQYFEPLG